MGLTGRVVGSVGDQLDTSCDTYRSGILPSLRRPVRSRLRALGALSRMTGGYSGQHLSRAARAVTRTLPCIVEVDAPSLSFDYFDTLVEIYSDFL